MSGSATPWPRDVLLLQFDAPLMAFGGPVVDQVGPSVEFPGISQIVGLVGNALGRDHRDDDALARLQARMALASAIVARGERMVDYQTVDLGQPHLVRTGWTTRGTVEARAGANAEETHIRLRQYWADAHVVSAVALDPADEEPTVGTIAAALEHPARPLFLGRKPCLPSAPVLLGVTRADGLLVALARAFVEDELAARLALARGTEAPAILSAEWPEGESIPDGVHVAGADAPAVSIRLDRRDWANQLHGGERRVHRGTIVASASNAPEVLP